MACELALPPVKKCVGGFLLLTLRVKLQEWQQEQQGQQAQQR
jgi:hypothetical protein